MGARPPTTPPRTSFPSPSSALSKCIHDIERMALIAGTPLCTFVNGEVSNVLTMLSTLGFVLNAITTREFFSTRHRGTAIAAAFAMQGFGIIADVIIEMASAKGSILKYSISQLG
ncbi:hypothetical protein Pcac1_g310 [Phytophthora cactorum]|uniref:Uncharacterized protein n=2 Tax=Phytophthora cactorum TaxID=29920 RepID=A0A8T1EQA7_9STRA|nr:hypothetical protein Pcac1_g310 [Phytophthora cactorum]KAG2849148.1 hypothetical protein PC112_g407 [Phytophthora cactorum]KAG2935060.1 hypothetical protein PC114_g769 [Phytophthora cactorum]KAG2955867.1 hypothetical protein PC117_g36 [Phytophthora cactorum]KAG3036338.1 hypothetical protein PC120_g296 [Phytophthora cactorum]